MVSSMLPHIWLKHGLLSEIEYFFFFLKFASVWDVVSSISLMEKQNKMLSNSLRLKKMHSVLTFCFLVDLSPWSYWKTVCNFMPLMKKCAHASTDLWCLPHAPSQAAVRSCIWCSFPRPPGRCETASFQSWQDMASHLIFNYRSSVSFNFDFLGSSLCTLQTFLPKFPIYSYPVFKVWIWAKKVCVDFFSREYGFK